MGSGAELPVPTQTKQCTRLSLWMGPILSFLYKMETNLIENVNEEALLSIGSGPNWLHVQPVLGSWMEMPCAIFSILWEKFTVLWLRSRNESTIAAPALIRRENSVCAFSVLSPSFLPVASNDDDINNRFEKENKGFMTLVLFNTLEQSACKASGAIKARVLALSEVTSFLSMFIDCLELAWAHRCDCLYWWWVPLVPLKTYAFEAFLPFERGELMKEIVLLVTGSPTEL